MPLVVRLHFHITRVEIDGGISCGIDGYQQLAAYVCMPAGVTRAERLQYMAETLRIPFEARTPYSQLRMLMWRDLRVRVSYVAFNLSDCVSCGLVCL